MRAHFEEKFRSLGGIVPIGGSFVAMTEEELMELENRLQTTLPETYREFLLTYGASMFAEYVDFKVIDELPSWISSNGKAHFSLFYGAVEDPHQSLSNAIATFENRMPASLIPIGDDSGNKICLGIHGDEKGIIYYWDRQNEPLSEDEYLEDYGVTRPTEAMFGNVHRIAESFEDFIMRLEVHRD